MGNAHTHDRRKSGAPETGLTIEGIREKPLEIQQTKEKKASEPPSFCTQGVEVQEVQELQGSPLPPQGVRSRRGGTQVEVEHEQEVEQVALEAGRVQEGHRQGLPTIFKFAGDAKEAYVAGTFSQWEKIPMVKSMKDFVALVDLPVGEHQFKYYVDEAWTHDKTLPMVSNELGSQNNVITIQQEDFEAFAALDMDSATTNTRHKRGVEQEFGQEIPGLSSFESKPGPPILPPHLLQV